MPIGPPPITKTVVPAGPDIPSQVKGSGLIVAIRWLDRSHGRPELARLRAKMPVPWRDLFIDEDVPDSAESRDEGERLAGPSGAMRRVRADVRLVGKSKMSVLILGVTGVGKELVAGEIHRLSARSGSYVALNCAAIPAALAESELFGHAAGAFTGATKRREGLFQAAAGGTLFLDEVGELPLDLQPKLLRTLADGQVRPVGSAGTVATDVRIIAATNRDLDGEVARGRFRADLYARLAARRIDVPPLRARRDDVLPLTQRFLTEPQLGVDAAEALLLYDYPYNARELEQIVAAAARRAKADPRGGAPVVRWEHLPERLQMRRRPASPSDPSSEQTPAHRAPPQQSVVEQALAETKGNVVHAARRLGTNTKQVYRWIDRFGLDVEKYRG